MAVTRTQVGRPGDPATRRPGDPATRRPGDPATRRPGLIITAASSAIVKPTDEHASVTLPFRPAPPRPSLPSRAVSIMDMVSPPMVIASPPNLPPGVSRATRTPAEASPVPFRTVSKSGRNAIDDIVREADLSAGLPTPCTTMREAATTQPRASASVLVQAVPHGRADSAAGEPTDPVRRRPRGHMSAAPVAFAEHVDGPVVVQQGTARRGAAGTVERTGRHPDATSRRYRRGNGEDGRPAFRHMRDANRCPAVPPLPARAPGGGATFTPTPNSAAPRARAPRTQHRARSRYNV